MGPILVIGPWYGYLVALNTVTSSRQGNDRRFAGGRVEIRSRNSRKSAEDIAISATCVRVPVLTGHSEAIHIEFSSHMSPEEAERILAQAPGVKILDDPAISLYPQPWQTASTDEVFVGRIRQDASHPNGLVMWVAADNLRKGAALNAVQIAEKMVERGWIHPTGGQK